MSGSVQQTTTHNHGKDDENDAAWQWESPDPPAELTEEQNQMLDVVIEEVRRSPLSSAVTHGGRSAIWRYLNAARWGTELSGKRVSSYFLETLEWRKLLAIDRVLEDKEHAASLLKEAATGKLFVRGTCLFHRPLIWLHLGRENNALDPVSNVRLLVYTVERAIASMAPEALGAKAKGQFCVVIDCTFAGAGPLPSLQFAQQAVRMLMARYPSRLGKLFLVNPGVAVYFLWQAISLLLEPVTREKIVVVSGTREQQRELLLNYISPEDLRAGQLGCPEEPPFNAEAYLAGGDGEGMPPDGGRDA